MASRWLKTNCLLASATAFWLAALSPVPPIAKGISYSLALVASVQLVGESRRLIVQDARRAALTAMNQELEQTEIALHSQQQEQVLYEIYGVKMATSPVKADRDAIARLERECQTDIAKIAATLEDSKIIVQAINSQQQGKGLKILATGIFWSGVIGIATMFVRPSSVWCGVSLGFVSGIAGRVMQPFKS